VHFGCCLNYCCAVCLAQALTDLKQFEKADENFKRALELEPDNGNIYVHRGLVCELVNVPDCNVEY
jgi:tetratricopeptide (TPR) repeat protein